VAILRIEGDPCETEAKMGLGGSAGSISEEEEMKEKQVTHCLHLYPLQLLNFLDK